MVPCAAPLRMAREPRETTLDSMMVTGDEEITDFSNFARRNKVGK